MLRDVPFFRTYTGGVLQDARVKLINTEARAYAGTTKEKFDLVEIGLVDSIGLSQPAATRWRKTTSTRLRQYATT